MSPNDELLQRLGSHICGHGLPYVVMGDFNAPPELVSALLPHYGVDGVVLHTGCVTCRPNRSHDVTGEPSGDKGGEQKGPNIDFLLFRRKSL